jgi:hypothetical protein
MTKKFTGDDVRRFEGSRTFAGCRSCGHSLSYHRLGWKDVHPGAECAECRAYCTPTIWSALVRLKHVYLGR